MKICSADDIFNSFKALSYIAKVKRTISPKEDETEWEEVSVIDVR